MELKFEISVKDSIIIIKYESIEGFKRAIPAYIKNEQNAAKAQKLVQKIIKIHKALQSLME